MLHAPASLPALPPAEESRRLAALRACEVLNTAPEGEFDELVALAVRVSTTPMAAVSLVDESRLWFKARTGFDVREIPREHAFCAEAILAPTPLIVEDAARDARFSDHPWVSGPRGVRFYAGFPLELTDGVRLGTLCILDTQPRGLTAGQRAALLALSHQASAQLELRRARHALRRLRECERHDGGRSVEAWASESFRIDEVLHRAMAEDLWETAKALRACVSQAPGQDTALREALLNASERVTEAAIDCRSLASRIPDLALPSFEWLATVRADSERLQREHSVHITLEAGIDPDQVLSYTAAKRLCEFVHAALLIAIELGGARRLSVALVKRGSTLDLTIRHDGMREGSRASQLHPASRLHVLAAELGSAVRLLQRDHSTELHLAVTAPSSR